MKDYRDCPYWKENRCLGFNCCLEEDCKHAEKYQPWLKSRIKLDTAAFQGRKIQEEAIRQASQEYFQNVTKEQFISDLRKAGFSVRDGAEIPPAKAGSVIKAK